MKKVAKNVLIILLIILLLNNFICSSCYANDYAIETVDDIIDILTGGVGILVAVLTLPLRFVAIGVGYGFNILTARIAYVDKATEGNSVEVFITPFDIFFNKVKLFEINFFDIADDGSISSQIRASVAGWYYVMRTLAAAILLVILIYVGIRMAISTVASDRAMYKRMLVDWVASLALIFVLQYIMIFTISANDAIVKAMSLVVDSEAISNVYHVIAEMAIPISIKSLKTIISLDSLAATVIFCMLVWQTLGLVFSYFNRMLKLAFLVIISPLISLTYSIDKMGDGKAQALGTWLKEFVFTILIQPFHCVIYMCFIDAAFDLLVAKSGSGGVIDSGGALVASILAILCVKFTKEGEKIVRKIFAFKDDNSTTSLAAGMAASAIALNQAKNIGKTARSTVNGAKNFVKGISPGVKTAIAEVGATFGAIDNIGKSNDSDDEGKKKTTFAQRKEEIRNQLDNTEAKIREKITDGAESVGEIFKRKTKLKKVKEQREAKIEKEKNRLISQNPTLSKERAEAMAKLNVSKENTLRNRSIKDIKKATGTITKHIPTETLSVISDLTRKNMMDGVAVMMGSGIYGTSGDFATAIISGAAVSSGLSEFMSGSKNTIATGIIRNLKKIKYDSLDQKIPMAKELDNISNQSEKYDVGDGKKGEETLKKLLKEIVDEAGLGENEKFSKKIDTTIKKVKNSPLYADSILTDFANDVNAEAINKPSEVKEPNGAEESKETNPRTELINFGNRVAVSQQLQAAESAGISIDDISDSVSEEEVSESKEDKYSETLQIVETVSTSKSIDETFPDIDVTKLEEKDLIELSKRFEREEKELRKLLVRGKKNNDTELTKEMEEALARIKVQKAQLISEALSADERTLSEAGIKLAREYQKKLDDAINDLQKENKNNAKIAELNEIKQKLDTKLN